MSRLKGSRFRLEKAEEIMAMVEHGPEDERPMDIDQILVRIAKDIPRKMLLAPKAPWSDEWQTLATVARVACLVEIVNIALCDVVEYIPKHATDPQIQKIYDHIQKGELGFGFQFTSVAMRYWMMDTVRVSPAQMTAIFGVVAIPWCLKPIYGFISDSYPICGYRRRPYMIGFSYIAAFMWILLPFVPHDEFVITLVMALSSGSMCFADVMADSLLVEAAREEKDDQKGIVQSHAWMMRFTGGLLASGLGAIAYDYLGPVQVFLLNSLIPVAITYVALWIPDKKSTSKINMRDTGRKLWSAIRQPRIYCPAIFIFLICVTPSSGGAMTFFYQRELGFTADEFGLLDTMGFLVQIFGTYVYKKFLRRVSFIKVFGCAMLISFLLENTLLLLVLHVNRDLGIPDFVFAFAERVVLTLISQFITMPMVVLGAQICPVGVEGTLYALLMSITNFGGVISSEWGSLFTNMFGVTSTNFTNLWKLLLLCNMMDLIPIASLGLLRGIKLTD